MYVYIYYKLYSYINDIEWWMTNRCWKQRCWKWMVDWSWNLENDQPVPRPERPGDGEGDMDVSPDDTGGGLAAGFDDIHVGKVDKVWEKYKVCLRKKKHVFSMCFNEVLFFRSVFCTFSWESGWIRPLGWVWYAHIWESSWEGVITGAPNNAEHMLQIVTAYAWLVYVLATAQLQWCRLWCQDATEAEREDDGSDWRWILRWWGRTAGPGQRLPADDLLSLWPFTGWAIRGIVRTSP